MIVLIFTLCLLPCTANGANDVPEKVLDARYSIVRIICASKDNISGGTGFAIGDKDSVRYIVTNYHVVAKNPSGVLVNYKGIDPIKATVYKQRVEADICILELEEPIYNMVPLTIEDSGAAQTGDAVYALGFPGAADYTGNIFGADPEQATVTDGIISAIKTGQYPLLTGLGSEIEMIQINAAISGGNSGGPLVNHRGQVIGINTFSSEEGENLNVAISAQELVSVLNAAGLAYTAPSTEQTSGPAWWLWAIIAAAVIVLGLLVSFTAMRKRSRKKYNFDDYFINTRRDVSEKLYAIKPVVEQVSQMHKDGRFSLDICPENIRVESTKAKLAVRDILNQHETPILRAGYSAPELYDGRAVSGPRSDVYALCAVLYTVMTGNVLSPAFKRADDTDIDFGQHFDGEYKKLTALITNGLTVDNEQRTLAADQLLIQLEYCVTGKETAKTALPQDERSRSHRPYPWPKKRKVIVVAAACVVVLLVAGAGLISVAEANYQRLVKAVENGDVVSAQMNASGVFAFYKDGALLCRYVDACIMLEGNEFDKAEDCFLQLGDYRNAPDMAREARYRQAKDLMQNGDYDLAKAIFEQLGSYKDASDMADRVEYEGRYTSALQNIEQEAWAKALVDLKAVDPYRDSAVLIAQVKQEIYADALTLFDNQEYDNAKEHFSLIPAYMDAGEYAGLIDMVKKADCNNFLRADYARMLDGAQLTDISPFLLKDGVIQWFLEGRWEGAGYYLQMTGDADSGMALSYDLPWYSGYDTYSFSNAVCILHTSDGTRSQEQYQFIYEDMDTIKVYCYKNDQYYTMHRQ